jgi:DNA-binding XRE family transcriptional regulator
MSVITGRQIKCARLLAGVDQSTVALEADISRATLSRMEAAETEPVHCHSATLEAVLAALTRHGVMVTVRGVELIAKIES